MCVYMLIVKLQTELGSSLSDGRNVNVSLVSFGFVCLFSFCSQTSLFQPVESIFEKNVRSSGAVF